jgi:hypothetical protein
MESLRDGAQWEVFGSLRYAFEEDCGTLVSLSLCGFLANR